MDTGEPVALSTRKGIRSPPGRSTEFLVFAHCAHGILSPPCVASGGDTAPGQVDESVRRSEVNVCPRSWHRAFFRDNSRPAPAAEPRLRYVASAGIAGSPTYQPAACPPRLHLAFAPDALVDRRGQANDREAVYLATEGRTSAIWRSAGGLISLLPCFLALSSIPYPQSLIQAVILQNRSNSFRTACVSYWVERGRGLRPGTFSASAGIGASVGDNMPPAGNCFSWTSFICTRIAGPRCTCNATTPFIARPP